MVKWLCSVAVLLCLLHPAWADSAIPDDAELLIVHVTLNTAEAGDFFVRQTRDHDLLAELGVLKEIGLVLPDAPDSATFGEQADKRLISLNSLSPQLEFKLDAESGTLALNAQTALLPNTSRQLRTRQTSQASLIQDDALFLNYNLNHTQSAGGPSNLTAPLELGANWHGISLVNNFNWQQGKALHRTQSQLTYDQPASLQRWMAGDIQGSADNRIGGAALGGVSLMTNFGLVPNMFTGPPLALKATLLTPSEVEVRTNGATVFKDNFPAGELDLNNIPYFMSGLGKVEIVVRDAFGKETVYDKSFYASTALLAPGLHAYNYALGVQRLNNAAGGLNYGSKPMLFATHRYGLTDWITPGIGLETDGQDMRAGLMTDIILSNYGQLSLVGAGSQRQGVSGTNLQADYNFAGAGISPGLFFTKQSRNYGGILEPLALSTTANQWRGGATLATTLGRIGSVSGRWSRSRNFAGATAKDVSLLYSTVLPGQISLTTQLTRNWLQQQLPSDTINLSLGHNFSNGLYLSASLNRTNQRNTFGVQLQLSPPIGEGMGYSVSASAPQQGVFTSSERLQYHHQYGELNLGRSGSNNAPSYDARFSGSVVLMDGGVHFARPVRDGFALLRVKGMKNVNVSVQNQNVGKTDDKGELLLPYLHAYTDNTVSIDADVIPLGYSLERSTQIITTSYRGGGTLNFAVKKIHVIGGTVYFRRGGKLVSAQYSALEYQDGKQAKRAIVGFGGELYLENISTGSYPAKLVKDHDVCHFDLVIPETDEIINDIGDVICDSDQPHNQESKP